MHENTSQKKLRRAWPWLTSLLLAIPIAAQYEQYEDLVDAPDAPTITKDEKGIFCTIEGVVMETTDTGDEGKEVKIIYLLTEKPSAYFSYYDAEKKALIFDFYDTRIGSSIIEPIQVDPITTSSVELFKVDLNKDVAGLRPDMRDVVRVSLQTPYDINYEVHEDYGVITMSFKWSKKVQRAFSRKENAFYWKFPLALAVLGGGGYAGYHYFLKEEPDPPPADPVPGFPPARP